MTNWSPTSDYGKCYGPGAIRSTVAEEVQPATGVRFRGHKRSRQLERLSVKRSPDAGIVQPLLEALGNWIFKPAQIDGTPVALKVLLGIRLTLGS
jgi:hypothetical protein